MPENFHVGKYPMNFTVNAQKSSLRLELLSYLDQIQLQCSCCHSNDNGGVVMPQSAAEIVQSILQLSGPQTAADSSSSCRVSANDASDDIYRVLYIESMTHLNIIILILLLLYAATYQTLTSQKHNLTCVTFKVESSCTVYEQNPSNCLINEYLIEFFSL